jgi:hypothetical protein
MASIHMGAQLEKIIRRHYNITEVAVAMGISRVSLYNWFKRQDLDERILDQLSKVFKENDIGVELNLLAHKYTPERKPNILKNEEYWKTKYIELLEKMHQLTLEQNLKDKAS